jgi:lipopolysaccharide transport system permease protein
MTSMSHPIPPSREAAPADSSEQVIVLEPGYAERHYWRSLWQYRELFLTLAWRDIAVRYKQTVIGMGWAVIRPLVTTITFTIVFGGLAKLPSDGTTPYAVLVLAGMVPWFLFSTGIGDASNSLVGNSGLIGKVYFPRMIVPLSATIVALVDALISLGLLFLFMLYFRIVPGWEILLLPFFIALCLLASIGPSLIFASYTVKYRDIRFLIPFIMQLGIYISPVGFSSAVVPEKWRPLYYLNPLVGIIDGFRWCLLGGESNIYWPGFALSLVIVGFVLWLGIRVFRRTERTFADVM